MKTHLDVVRARVRERMNELADAVSTGAAEDYPSYMKMVGVIEGLAFAERDILDQIEKLVQD